MDEFYKIVGQYCIYFTMSVGITTIIALAVGFFRRLYLRYKKDKL